MTADDHASELSSIVGELRAELDRLPATGRRDAPATGEARLGLRRMHEAAAITADHPPLVRPGALAPARRMAKRALQKVMRWYIERLAADVRDFAEAATAVSGGLAERGAALDERLARLDERLGRLEEAHGATARALQGDLERSVAGLRDRMSRLERAGGPARPPAPARATAAPSSAAADEGGGAHAFDYYAFETLMRGSREEIGERQRDYLERFADVDDILDVGCGRGEFLSLLTAAGKRARGIDIDADMVAQCRADGLEVEQADAVAHLGTVEPGSLGGVFAAQVVEHMRPPALVAFLEAARAALAPGGVIVLETINPGSLSALRNYFADLTHAQPLVPETLRFLVESAGFADARVALRSPVPEDGRLQHVPYGEVVPDAAQVVSRRNVDLVNAILFAPQDYSVTARA